MPALHASKSKSAALAAAAIITGAAGAAFGQQLAATGIAAERHAHIVRQCGAIDRASLECVARSSIEFDRAQTAVLKKQSEELRKQAAADRAAIAEHQKAIAEHQKAAGAARTEAQCLNALSAALIGKRITAADIDRAEKTPTATTDMCEVVRRLQPRLGLNELTKQ
jgi:hypothetical protein